MYRTKPLRRRNIGPHALVPVTSQHTPSQDNGLRASGSILGKLVISEVGILLTCPLAPEDPVTRRVNRSLPRSGLGRSGADAKNDQTFGCALSRDDSMKLQSQGLPGRRDENYPRPTATIALRPDVGWWTAVVQNA